MDTKRADGPQRGTPPWPRMPAGGECFRADLALFTGSWQRGLSPGLLGVSSLWAMTALLLGSQPEPSAEIQLKSGYRAGTGSLWRHSHVDLLTGSIRLVLDGHLASLEN